MHISRPYSSRVRISLLAAALSLALPLHASEADPAAVAPASEAGAQGLRLHGIRINGVGDHGAAGVTPARVQAWADDALRELAGAPPVRADFALLQQIAERITASYRSAGFLVATAYLPPQTVGADGVVRIEVIEGTIGRVLVQGSQRYRDAQIAASSVGLIGRPAHQRELDSALLYARDLPGVTLTPMLQPGLHTGETDIVLIAEDDARPYGVRVGISNHGTDSTGRYRAEAAISAYNALGAGDTLSAVVGYGIDPADSWQAAASLNLPFSKHPGLSGVFGLSRSELELNTGPFSALEIHGPTTIGYAGVDWTFVQSPGLLARASARWIHEESRLDGLGIELSRHKFDVLETGLSLRHTDRRLRGVNFVQASVRKSINDESPAFNWLYARHDPHFLVGRVSLARLQALPGQQRLLLRGNAQFTGDVLAPLEQFAIGGPDSVRAFALSSGLGDRGVQATMEYQVDAPGFAGRASPFNGHTWRDLLTLSAFYDWGRVSPAAAGRRQGVLPTTLEGAGVGVGLRLPWQPDLRLDVSAARPTGRTSFTDDGVQVWARIGMTF